MELDHALRERAQLEPGHLPAEGLRNSRRKQPRDTNGAPTSANGPVRRITSGLCKRRDVSSTYWTRPPRLLLCPTVPPWLTVVISDSPTAAGALWRPWWGCTSSLTAPRWRRWGCRWRSARGTATGRPFGTPPRDSQLIGKDAASPRAHLPPGQDTSGLVRGPPGRLEGAIFCREAVWFARRRSCFFPATLCGGARVRAWVTCGCSWWVRPPACSHAHLTSREHQ